MLLRPQLCLRPLRALPRPSIHVAHPHATTHQPLSQRHGFHTSPSRHDLQPTNHYDTLQLSPHATPAEVKKSYFSLSKKYHPDHNRDDPTASARFVQISEAYHVLGVPDKRAQYDRQLSRSSSDARSGYAPQQGSYSSHQTYAGSRPASGLNKKRSTFRGPPPSFYKSGGYGRQGAKREEYKYHNPHAGAEKQPGPESYGHFGEGFGPGQAGQGHHVPHFDDVRHKRTHENVHEHIQKRRRSRRKTEVRDFDPRSSFSSFVMIAGALTTIGLLAKGLQLRLGDKSDAKKDQRR